MSQHKPKAGKVALVTGAAQGIGRTFAERLATEGATVVAVDRQIEDGLSDALIRAGAPDALYLQVDVSDRSQVEACCHSVLDRFGRCDILINNAGIYPCAPFTELSYEMWSRTLAINLDSVFLFCKAIVPAMIANRYGRIVNVSSDTLGLVIEGFSHYLASKAGIIGLTRGLASELGVHGITANVIAPGATRTPSTREAFSDPDMANGVAQANAIKRLGEPEDLAGAMSFLTSDDATFMTAQTLIINGGLLRSL